MLRRAVRAYPTLLRVGFAGAVAYRAEFIVWMLSMTLPLVMLAIWSAVARDQSIGRFDEGQFRAYYIATLIVRQLTGSWVVWELVQEIKAGTLSMRLLKPIHPLVTLSADCVAQVPMRAMIVSPVVIAALFLTGPHHPHDLFTWFGCCAALLGAWLLNFCLSAIVGALAMVIDSSTSIWEIYLGLFFILSGYLVPLELLPRWMDRLAHVLPFAYLQALPVEALTSMQSRAALAHGLVCQWGYVVGAFAVLLVVWQRCSRHYAAFGG